MSSTYDNREDTYSLGQTPEPRDQTEDSSEEPFFDVREQDEQRYGVAAASTLKIATAPDEFSTRQEVHEKFLRH